MEKENHIREIQRKELIELTAPLRHYINENFNPHTTIIVDCNSFELLEGLIAFKKYEKTI